MPGQAGPLLGFATVDSLLMPTGPRVHQPPPQGALSVPKTDPESVGGAAQVLGS